jgi:hypothetical protein
MEKAIRKDERKYRKNGEYLSVLKNKDKEIRVKRIPRPVGRMFP